MRRALVVLVVVGLALSGGAVVLAGDGADTVTLCANKGGNVTWPGEDGECKKNETPITVASADAVAALQTEVDDLTGRVEALETLLEGVTRVAVTPTVDEFTFPGSVSADLHLYAAGGVYAEFVGVYNVNTEYVYADYVLAYNSVYTDSVYADYVNAYNDVNANGDVNAFDDVNAGDDVYAGDDVFADHDVYADHDVNGSGNVFVGVVQLDVP